MDLGAIGGMAANVGLTIFAILLACGLGIGIYFGYKNWKKYQEFKCYILERDGFGQQIMTTDMAGVFVDGKTGNKRFFLKRNNVGLNADTIPYLLLNGKKVVYLLKTGLKNFHYIRMNINNPKVTMSVGEEDINWAVNSYERAKKTFTENKFVQIMGMAILGITIIGILVLVMSVLNKFEVLGEISLNLKDAAQSLAATQGGNVTTVFVS